MARRRIVLVKFVSSGDGGSSVGGEMAALGTPEDVVAAFGRVNTATDKLGSVGGNGGRGGVSVGRVLGPPGPPVGGGGCLGRVHPRSSQVGVSWG